MVNDNQTRARKKREIKYNVHVRARGSGATQFRQTHPDDSCLFHNRRKSRGNPQWRPAFEIKTTKQRSTEERHALRRNPPTSDEGTRKGRWTDCVLFFDDHPESTRRSLDGFTKCPPHELRFAVVSKQQNVLAACRTTATVE